MIDPIYFLCILTPVLRAKYDYHTIEVEGKSVEYLKVNSLTLASMMICVTSIHLVTKIDIWNIFFVTLTTYWLSFDYLLNHYRGKPVLSYYGNLEDEVNLSFIEEHVYKNASWGSLLITKVSMFSISILNCTI